MNISPLATGSSCTGIRATKACTTAYCVGCSAAVRDRGFEFVTMERMAERLQADAAG